MARMSCLSQEIVTSLLNRKPSENDNPHTIA